MFLPAVVIVLILLSYLMYWTKVEQHSLFVLYIIQVRFKKKKTRHDLKRGIQSFLLCLNRRFYYCFCSSQAASVSLQGFLNSMVYAWRRPNFTEAVLGENTPLVGYNRLAFFDESLRSSSCWLQTHRDTFMLLQLALAWGTLAVCPQGSSLHRSLDWNIQRSHSQTEHEEKQNGRSFF